MANLARAEIDSGLREDESKQRVVVGPVVDFHALRVTFATSLARADVPLALAQRLMRHSTPVLTSNVYSKLELHDGHDAVARIDVAPAPRGSGRLVVKLAGPPLFQTNLIDLERRARTT